MPLFGHAQNREKKPKIEPTFRNSYRRLHRGK